MKTTKTTERVTTMIVKSKPLNVSYSQEISRKCRPKDGECYRNAFTALHCLPMEERKRAKYVEGWVPNIIGWTAHAWVELDGEIIDITPVYLNRHEQHIYRGVLYFSAEETMKYTIPAHLRSKNPMHKERMMKRLTKLARQLRLLTYCADSRDGFMVVPGTDDMWKKSA